VKGKTTKHKGIQDLGEGWFRIRVIGRDPKTGHRREIDRKVQANGMREAVRIRLAMIDALDKEQLVNAPPKKVGEFARAWLEEIKKRPHEEDPEQLHLCNATRIRYEGSIEKFIVPRFSDFFVDKLTAQDIKDWRVNLLERGFKRSSINGHVRVLKTILRAAGNHEGSKVSQLSEKPDAQISRKEPNLLTADELDRFLEIAERDWDRHYALILVLFTTTMRLSTALALRRDDIDLETMEFIVRRRLSTGVETPGVKRDRFGEDSPPLLPEVHEALKEHWATFTPIQEASGLMFPSREGAHHSRSVLVKPFEDILLKARITKRFTPHGCRRTGAKLYGKTAGTRVAMDIAGHLTDEMHRHYTPMLPEEKQAAARSVFSGLRVLNGGQPKPDPKVGIEVGIAKVGIG
jgi:integrase